MGSPPPPQTGNKLHCDNFAFEFANAHKSDLAGEEESSQRKLKYSYAEKFLIFRFDFEIGARLLNSYLSQLLGYIFFLCSFNLLFDPFDNKRRAAPHLS